jgi:hypothetical protein
MQVKLSLGQRDHLSTAHRPVMFWARQRKSPRGTVPRRPSCP